MPNATIAGHDVTVDADGFMTNRQEWTPEIARAIAASVGLELTERHWKVIDFCRADAAATGEPPGLRRIAQGAEVPIKELYQLFPKGPGILAARIAGLTKPKSCV